MGGGESGDGGVGGLWDGVGGSVRGTGVGWYRGTGVGGWGMGGGGGGVRIRVSPFFLCEERPPWLFKGLDFSFLGELFSSDSLGTKASRPASETRKSPPPKSG